MKHLLAIKDLDKSEIVDLIDLAAKIKANPVKYSVSLKGKSLVMIFQKTSTRTRLSFEIGMTQLGGHAAFLDWKDSNFAVGNIFDEVKCIGRYSDLVMARVYSHCNVERMAEVAGVPVINGLSDLEHPCQILADLMTIKEKKGDFDGLKLAFIGDGNNVCNSLIAGCSVLGISISVAAPKGYEPNRGIVEATMDTGLLELTNDPKEAVKGADIVYTDTWVSLGQEAEAEERLRVFRPYRLNSSLVPDGALVMHCLPAHRGYEITNEVIDGPSSIVFEQSENRLHMQKAIMLRLLGRA
ncbi:ornithine carbamoyltransferase [Candidatus Woesearchaeota archaeon]|nr:ornithine carbamoyltransferase [Candidatus Woesearchaeota archaeon]